MTATPMTAANRAGDRGSRPGPPRGDDRSRLPVALRRTGYLVAAAVNLAMLWIAHRLLDWEWPPVLTPAFDDLLPYVDLSLGATAAVNVLWAWRDPAWFRHLGQSALSALSLVLSLRTWQVFPLDFTGYAAWWETATRILLGVAIFGSAVSVGVELAGLARECRRAAPRRSLA